MPGGTSASRSTRRCTLGGTMDHFFQIPVTGQPPADDYGWNCSVIAVIWVMGPVIRKTLVLWSVVR